MNKWRLPTMQELKSIVDYTKYNPATNLGGIKSEFYWSSSPYVSDSSYAWSVRFCDGYDYYDYKSSSNYVRYVRTLDDGSLEWAKEDAPNQMTWQDAMDYAESLNIESKKTIVLETWLIGESITIEGTSKYLYETYGMANYVILSTREIEL